VKWTIGKRAQRRAVPSLDAVPPDLLAWAQVVNASRLSDQTAKDAEDYLRDYRHMNAFARHEVALRLVSVVAAQVSPPPPISLAPLDILATVVVTRRRQLGIG
jgi:hypothetical protein